MKRNWNWIRVISVILWGLVLTGNFYGCAGGGGGGNEAATNIAEEDIIPPDTPANLVAANCQNMTTGTWFVQLTWNKVEDAQTGQCNYKIWRDGVLISNSIKAIYQDLDVVNGKTYSYQVQASDRASNVSAKSAVSTVTVGPGGTPPPADITAPSVPMNLAVTATSSYQASATCTAATDNVAVTGYKWYKDGIVVSTTTTPAATITGLTPSKTYSFTVTAIDAAGNESAHSTAVSVTTPAATTPVTTSVSFNAHNLDVTLPIQGGNVQGIGWPGQTTASPTPISGVTRWLFITDRATLVGTETSRTDSAVTVRFYPVGNNGATCGIVAESGPSWKYVLINPDIIQGVGNVVIHDINTFDYGNLASPELNWSNNNLTVTLGGDLLFEISQGGKTITVPADQVDVAQWVSNTLWQDFGLARREPSNPSTKGASYPIYATGTGHVSFQLKNLSSSTDTGNVAFYLKDGTVAWMNPPQWNKYLKVSGVTVTQDSNGFTFTVGGSSAINGVCGSANGTTVDVAPTANLCTSGTASAVSGSGPWSWTCAGISGGTNATCSAQKSGGTQPPTGGTITARTVGFTATKIIVNFGSSDTITMGGKTVTLNTNATSLFRWVHPTYQTVQAQCNLSKATGEWIGELTITAASQSGSLLYYPNGSNPAYVDSTFAVVGNGGWTGRWWEYNNSPTTVDIQSNQHVVKFSTLSTGQVIGMGSVSDPVLVSQITGVVAANGLTGWGDMGSAKGTVSGSTATITGTPTAINKLNWCVLRSGKAPVYFNLNSSSVSISSTTGVVWRYTAAYDGVTYGQYVAPQVSYSAASKTITVSWNNPVIAGVNPRGATMTTVQVGQWQSATFGWTARAPSGATLQPGTGKLTTDVNGNPILTITGVNSGENGNLALLMADGTLAYFDLDIGGTSPWTFSGATVSADHSSITLN